MKRLFTAALVIVALHGVSLAQDGKRCATLDQKIKSTYNFKPSRLTDSERDSKSAAMDQFWNMVKADPVHLLPCLRAALEDTSVDKWFRFDASSLLVELDPSPGSKTTQVSCYTTAEMDDVDLRTWVTVLSARGAEGFDVSEAGSRWLAYPRATYFLPEHGGYQVTSFQGALFFFGSMDEAQATPALVKLLSEPGHSAREQALAILMSQATPESLRALRQLDGGSFSAGSRTRLQKLLTSPDLLKPRAQPKTSRAEFIRAFQEMLNGQPGKLLELVSSVPDGEKDVIAVLKPEDLPLVRKIRRRIIVGGNQHAIEYYNSFTQILMALVWTPDPVK